MSSLDSVTQLRVRLFLICRKKSAREKTPSSLRHSFPIRSKFPFFLRRAGALGWITKRSMNNKLFAAGSWRFWPSSTVSEKCFIVQHEVLWLLQGFYALCSQWGYPFATLRIDAHFLTDPSPRPLSVRRFAGERGDGSVKGVGLRGASSRGVGEGD